MDTGARRERQTTSAVCHGIWKPAGGGARRTPPVVRRGDGGDRFWAAFANSALVLGASLEKAEATRHQPSLVGARVVHPKGWSVSFLTLHPWHPHRRLARIGKQVFAGGAPEKESKQAEGDARGPGRSAHAGASARAVAPAPDPMTALAVGFAAPFSHDAEEPDTSGDSLPPGDRPDASDNERRVSNDLDRDAPASSMTRGDEDHEGEAEVSPPDGPPDGATAGSAWHTFAVASLKAQADVSILASGKSSSNTSVGGVPLLASLTANQASIPVPQTASAAPPVRTRGSEGSAFVRAATSTEGIRLAEGGKGGKSARGR